MFGLFKNSTPEGRLENDVKISLEKEIKIVLNEIDNNEVIAGIAIDGAISYIYKAYIDNVYLLSKGHGISEDKTISTIKKATNEVRKKHLLKSNIDSIN